MGYAILAEVMMCRGAPMKQGGERERRVLLRCGGVAI